MSRLYSKEFVKFPAKVLLTGEFTVLTSGTALAVPLSSYFSKWGLSKAPDPRLLNLIPHLSKISDFDINRYIRDINNGWHLESNIPIGYGLGSSGSVSAALLFKYGINNDIKDLYQLKIQLAEIEKFFHGTSSGFDPLISFTHAAYLVQHNNLTKVEFGNTHFQFIKNLFLFDSLQARDNIIPIDWFYQSSKEIRFQKTCTELNALNEIFISSILSLNRASFTESMKQISFLQLENFSPLIPEKLIPLWEQGLQSDEYYLKLCGKGGGGFYLIYVNEQKNILNKEFNVVPIC